LASTFAGLALVSSLLGELLSFYYLSDGFLSFLVRLCFLVSTWADASVVVWAAVVVAFSFFFRVEVEASLAFQVIWVPVVTEAVVWVWLIAFKFEIGL
jgi:hypothetical protein